MGLFINFTNHGSEGWTKKQLEASYIYGDIIDIPFPDIPATADENEIHSLANRYFSAIRDLKPAAVLCQGEFTFTFEVTAMLVSDGITVLAACTKRISDESVKNGKTVKTSVFEFVGYRKYNAGSALKKFFQKI